MPPFLKTILRQKLVAMATSLKGSQSDISGYQALHMPVNPENLVKIGPLDFESEN